MVDHEPWAGETPFFLLINSLEPNEGGAYGHLVLDVDKTGWQVEYKDWLERSAEWYLCEKQTDRVVMAQIVYRGEHPYFITRHVGQIKINNSASRSTLVYGIGKRVPAVYDTTGKRKKLVRPERTDRLWLLPGGVICGGEDVEKLAMHVVATLEWQAMPPEEGSVTDGEMVPEPGDRERDTGDRDGAGGNDRPVPSRGRGRRSIPRGDHPGEPGRDADVQLGDREDR